MCSAIAIFALREAWSDWRKGYGHMSKGYRPSREKDPTGFFIGVGSKIALGIVMLAMGIYFYFFTPDW